MGTSYEKLKIGQMASFSKTITETDICLFAGISGDFNPIHMDDEFARRSKFKRRIAHGAIALSLIAGVLGMKLPGMGTVIVEMKCSFRSPVYIGDTITATARVKEKMEEKRWVIMELNWTNQRQEEVIVGEAVVIPPSL